MRIQVSQANSIGYSYNTHIELFRCPNCSRNDILHRSNFCPNCGACIEWIANPRATRPITSDSFADALVYANGLDSQEPGSYRIGNVGFNAFG